jgi:hypothetical protein
MAIRIEYDNFFIRLVFSNTVDIKEANNILDELEPLEKQGNLQYLNRISDLRLVKRFDLNFDNVYALAQRRKKIKFRQRFKSALVVNSDLTMGFARMFQTLINHPDIDIHIFKTTEDAESWIENKT